MAEDIANPIAKTKDVVHIIIYLKYYLTNF